MCYDVIYPKYIGFRRNLQDYCQRFHKLSKAKPDEEILIRALETYSLQAL